jgi:hypothetical protein
LKPSRAEARKVKATEDIRESNARIEAKIDLILKNLGISESKKSTKKPTRQEADQTRTDTEPIVQDEAPSA